MQDVTILYAPYSGYVGTNFDPAQIPVLPNPLCMYSIPLQFSEMETWRAHCERVS